MLGGEEGWEEDGGSQEGRRKHEDGAGAEGGEAEREAGAEGEIGTGDKGKGSSWRRRRRLLHRQTRTCADTLHHQCKPWATASGGGGAEDEPRAAGEYKANSRLNNPDGNHPLVVGAIVTLTDELQAKKDAALLEALKGSGDRMAANLKRATAKGMGTGTGTGTGKARAKAKATGTGVVTGTGMGTGVATGTGRKEESDTTKKAKGGSSGGVAVGRKRKVENNENSEPQGPIKSWHCLVLQHGLVAQVECIGPACTKELVAPPVVYLDVGGSGSTSRVWGNRRTGVGGSVLRIKEGDGRPHTRRRAKRKHRWGAGASPHLYLRWNGRRASAAAAPKGRGWGGSKMPIAGCVQVVEQSGGHRRGARTSPTSTCGGTGAGQARRRRRGGGVGGSKMPIARCVHVVEQSGGHRRGARTSPHLYLRWNGRRASAASKVEGTGGVQGHPPTSTCGGTGAGQARRWRRGGGGGGEQNADSGLRARRRAKWRAQAGCKDIPPPLPAVERALGEHGGGAEVAGWGGSKMPIAAACLS
ncbi:hypothetical protein C8F04DRAFT_1185375 [Mycena alexandri]|uniref:Uncharacterized protein n=1 Tax=Mycena alexandri TaxID=1745969 RepID=A0AAD6X1A9_9AGAR|nr:hypothetical protein C8F04DRAFT_1185375 [Mycena alexandri]